MTTDNLTIEFNLDDEYRRALTRAAAVRMKLEVVDGARPAEFTVRVQSAEQAYRFGLETGFATFGEADA